MPSSSGIPYDLRDVFSWTKGKHDISFGYDLELDQSNIDNTDLENGSFSFNNDTSGLAMANFLMGYQNSFSQTSGDFSDSRENPQGVFGSDKWKVSPNLTLSFGAALGAGAGHEGKMGTHRAVLPGCLDCRRSFVHRSGRACRAVLYRRQVQRSSRCRIAEKRAT